MIVAWRSRSGARMVALESYVLAIEKGVIMIWETPVAIDLRLGMEITMYADHR